MSDSNDFTANIDGAASLSAMSRAVDSLSTSAPSRTRNNQNGSVTSAGTPTEFGQLLFSPGGYSYGTKSASGAETGAKSKTLKQAKGTGRKIRGTPNERSYSQLVDAVEKTPGAEIRIVNSNEGLNLSENQKLRMKYYDSIRKNAGKANLTENRRRAFTIQEDVDGESAPLLGGSNSINNETDGFLEYPLHLLPSNFFHMHIPGVDKEDVEETQSSLVTIMSIWNTMMGTSLLAVPWAIEHSGLAMGFTIVFVMTIISFYTAFIIIDLYGKHNSPETPVLEFSHLCGKLLGPFWDRVCSVFSLLAVLGAAIVYWVLMSNFLFNSVDFFIGLSNGNTTSDNASVTEVFCPKKPDGGNGMFIVNISTINDTTFDDNTGNETTYDGIDNVSSIFTPKTAPLFLIFLLPVISLKSPTFFTKFNSVGTLNVFFLIGVVIFLGSSWGLNANFSDETSDVFVPMFKKSFPSLSGMMALGLFIHNAIITIMRNNRYQENNRRDLAAGFSLVSGTYLMIGIIYYLTFPMAKECIEDNFLNNFHVNNPLIVAARLMLLFQLFTVFPLVMFILRAQVFMLFSRHESVGYRKIYLVNGATMTIAILFAILMPSIGNIIRYSGALCGAVVLFILPSLVFLASAKKDGKLTVLNVSVHLVIICLGIANFGAQFFV